MGGGPSNKKAAATPVGVSESDEGELLGAVEQQVLRHLAEVSETQRRPEEELG